MRILAETFKIRVKGGKVTECPGRDRDTGLCWDRAVVQTSWPLKINHAGLMPRALSERKSGLEVRRTMSEITFWIDGGLSGPGVPSLKIKVWISTSNFHFLDL